MKRLGQVVIRAGIEADDAVVDGVASGEHEDWNRLARRAEFPAHVEAALDRQHQVENHDVVGRLRDPLNRGNTIAGDVDGIALFAQPLRDHAGRSAFVLDEQNSHVRPTRIWRTRHSSGPDSIEGRTDE